VHREDAAHVATLELILTRLVALAALHEALLGGDAGQRIQREIADIGDSIDVAEVTGDEPDIVRELMRLHAAKILSNAMELLPDDVNTATITHLAPRSAGTAS
jgi:hypothetical protein